MKSLLGVAQFSLKNIIFREKLRICPATAGIIVYIFLSLNILLYALKTWIIFVLTTQAYVYSAFQ